MIELAIGTRFYYKGRLCEVVETAYDRKISNVLQVLGGVEQLV